MSTERDRERASFEDYKSPILRSMISLAEVYAAAEVEAMRAKCQAIAQEVYHGAQRSNLYGRGYCNAAQCIVDAIATLKEPK